MNLIAFAAFVSASFSSKILYLGNMTYVPFFQMSHPLSLLIWLLIYEQILRPSLDINVCQLLLKNGYV